METASVDNNLGDIGEIIQRDLYDGIPEHDPKTISEILAQAENVSEPQNEDDLETKHTAVENPILEIPIAERAINTYKNQIIITTGDFTEGEKVFSNSRMYATISKRSIRDEIVHFVRDYVNPKLKYAIFFKQGELPNIFASSIFRNDGFKFVQSSKMLTDNENSDEQKEKLNSHISKICH